MRQFFVLLLSSSLLPLAGLGGCASSETVAQDNSNKLICREDRRLGSNLPRKVCKPASTLEAERSAYQEELRNLSPGPIDLQQPSGGPN